MEWCLQSFAGFAEGIASEEVSGSVGGFDDFVGLEQEAVALFQAAGGVG